MWLCIAIHLYYGPIAPGTEVVEAVEECSRVSQETMRTVVSDCAAEGPMRCEVTEDTRLKRRVTVIEHKVRVPR